MSSENELMDKAEERLNIKSRRQRKRSMMWESAKGFDSSDKTTY